MPPLDAPSSARLDQSELEAYWLPFTANRAFKRHPRLIERAEGMYYVASDGRRLDAMSGLWCCNAGHCRAPITEAITSQAARLDYAASFQLGHSGAFRLSSKLAALAPGDLRHVFFCTSGSEAVDTALKIALAYHKLSGQSTRTMNAAITAPASAAPQSEAFRRTAICSSRCFQSTASHLLIRVRVNPMREASLRLVPTLPMGSPVSWL
jgi:4-aminobutyrate aminotransferase-like enzyme